MTSFDVPDFKNDHDAIVAMFVELRQLRSDFNKIAENLAEVASKKQMEDHERRIKNLERALWIGLGILTVIEFVGREFIISIIKQ